MLLSFIKYKKFLELILMAYHKSACIGRVEFLSFMLYLVASGLEYFPFQSVITLPACREKHWGVMYRFNYRYLIIKLNPIDCLGNIMKFVAIK